MAASNPSPARITAPLWRFWTEFDAFEPTVALGGVYAAKPGYHNYRNALPASDYSSGRDVAADKQGPGTMASAIDLTMSDAAMTRYTKRLDTAARARDPRLYRNGHAVLREFIGTKDNRTVYCYVLVGGRALGVGADAGPDPGRDSSHLWHVHLSIIRQYVNDWSMLDGVLSVLKGESLQAWQDRVGEEDMPNPLRNDNDFRALIFRVEALQTLAETVNNHVNNTQEPNALARAIHQLLAEQQAAKLREEAILAAVQGASAAEIRAQIDQRAAELAAGQERIRADLARQLAAAAPRLVATVRRHTDDVNDEELIAEFAQELDGLAGQLSTAPATT